MPVSLLPIKSATALSATPTEARVALCPPATLVHQMSAVLSGSAIETGGQDCHDKPSGAFTVCTTSPLGATRTARPPFASATHT